MEKRTGGTLFTTIIILINLFNLRSELSVPNPSLVWVGISLLGLGCGLLSIWADSI